MHTEPAINSQEVLDMTLIKLDGINVKYLPDVDRWQWDVSYPKRAFRRFPEHVRTKSQAISEAVKIAEEIKRTGKIPRKETEKQRIENTLTVADALYDALKVSRTREYVRKMYENYAGQFLDWLNQRYPEIIEWKELHPLILSEYHQHLYYKGVSYSGQKNALHPIRFASRYWETIDPYKYRNIYKMARIIVENDSESVPVAMDLNQVFQWLNWVKSNAKELYPIACLTSLCGLRLYEAHTIRYCDLDLKNNTIHIRDAGWHKVKTKASRRTITPVSFVANVIKDYIAELKVLDINPESHVFKRESGADWTKSSVDSAWKYCMIKARKDETLDLPANYKGRNGRSTFATLAHEAGVEDRALKTYIGHTSGDVLGNHYLARMRDHVTEKLENSFQKVFKTEQILTYLNEK